MQLFLEKGHWLLNLFSEEIRVISVEVWGQIFQPKLPTDS